MEFFKKMWNLFLRFPILASLAAGAVFAASVGICYGIIEVVSSTTTASIEDYAEFIPIMIMFMFFYVYPFVLTLLNLAFLFLKPRGAELIKAGNKIEITTVVVGAFFSWGYSIMLDMTFSPWYEQLVNSQRHSPVSPERLPAVIIIAVLAAAAYIFLRIADLENCPPLTLALAMGAMYLGAALCAVWSVQIFAHARMLALLPFNFILFMLKAVKRLVLCKADSGKGMLAKIADRLWPGLIAALPVLGIALALAHLFGGKPDDIAKVWTETADWTFSQQIAPPNNIPDGHYLCTVAAQGHKAVVKPQRLGMRHGRVVVVNRQLCVANAFEQLLEEKTPRLQRAVRSFYDKHGLPLSKLINKKWKADIVYIVMKPLEWLFFLILYLFDSEPEKRISVQYPCK